MGADALKSIGNVVSIRFTKDWIECLHCNSDTNVFLIIRINTEELVKYEFYCSTGDEIIIGLNPSDVSNGLPNKKTETLAAIYENGRLEYGTYATIQPGSAPSVISQLQLRQSNIFRHIEAEYPDKPHIKVTGAHFRKILNDLDKSLKTILLRPYEKGLEFISVNLVGIPVTRRHIGIIGGVASPLYYPPTYEDVSYNPIPGNHQSDIVHYDHIAAEYDHIVPLLLVSKLTDDTSLIKIYFNPDRNVPIKFTGPQSTEGDWRYWIKTKPAVNIPNPVLNY